MTSKCSVVILAQGSDEQVSMLPLLRRLSDPKAGLSFTRVEGMHGPRTITSYPSGTTSPPFPFSPSLARRITLLPSPLHSNFFDLRA
jgi:hypothetical protein